MSIAENQRPACELRAASCWLLAAGCWLLAAGCWLLAAGCWLLAEASVIDYLGRKEQVTAEHIRHRIQDLLDAAEQRQRLSAAGAALVDGSGARRVSLAMHRSKTMRIP
ncbi:hypothetical protein [Lamprobacter sp.]|uniref:hypothetical protein n=1 Tax=Lamprobacter sp. TaxID=3100796 RepID=UPI002B262FD9|nr:hypothetical protein [Lamprobacter sp.]